MNAGRYGCVPVATRMNSARSTRGSLPSGGATRTVWASTNEATPGTTSIPCRSRFLRMRLRSDSTRGWWRKSSVAPEYGFGIASTAASRPRDIIPVRASALSRMVFEGSVPVFVQAPPRSGARRSTSATFLPKYAACAAPFSPAGPLPRTSRSYEVRSMRAKVSSAPSVLAGAPTIDSPREKWTDRGHRIWSVLLAVAAATNVLALWSAPYLPFTDLPQHAAAIATLRHFDDPAWKSREYFTLALGRSQYLLYYLAGALLAFPFRTAERANLVLLSISALAFPYALRSLLRAMGAAQRLALFAVPLFWSQSLLIGFFNYVAALPLLLWALAVSVREAEAPRPARTVLLAALSVALFYLHLSAFLLFAPAAALAQVILGPRRRADLAPRI